MTKDIKICSENYLLQITNLFDTGQYDIQICLKFGLENADIAVLKFCLRSSFVGLLFLGTSSSKIRRYLHCVGFVEAADCKIATRYSFNKTATKSVFTVFPCDQEFFLTLLTFSKERHEMIMCMLCLSELIFPKGYSVRMLLLHWQHTALQV